MKGNIYNQKGVIKTTLVLVIVVIAVLMVVVVWWYENNKKEKVVNKIDTNVNTTITTNTNSLNKKSLLDKLTTIIGKEEESVIEKAYQYLPQKDYFDFNYITPIKKTVYLLKDKFIYIIDKEKPMGESGSRYVFYPIYIATSTGEYNWNGGYNQMHNIGIDRTCNEIKCFVEAIDGNGDLLNAGLLCLPESKQQCINEMANKLELQDVYFVTFSVFLPDSNQGMVGINKSTVVTDLSGNLIANVDVEQVFL